MCMKRGAIADRGFGIKPLLIDCSATGINNLGQVTGYVYIGPYGVT